METTPSSPPTFLLFFRNSGPEAFQHLSPQQRQELMIRWNTWYEELLAQGKALGGQPLESETRLVSGTGGTRLTDGPFIEAKEAIGGYCLLKVNGWDEATAIAQQHPALVHGLRIEVRQLAQLCSLERAQPSSLATV